MKPIRLVVLISGYGSNLQALMDAIQAGQLSATIVAVVSDHPEAYGLQRAKAAHLPIEVLPPQFSSDIFITLLQQYSPDLIVLAGFMKILKPKVIQAFSGKIMNIHPSLLPRYKGLDTYRRVLEAGETEHGTTIHWVTEALDSGPIIYQERCFIEPNESETSLKQRVKTLENKIYPVVIEAFAQKKFQFPEEFKK